MKCSRLEEFSLIFILTMWMPSLCWVVHACQLSTSILVGVLAVHQHQVQMMSVLINPGTVESLPWNFATNILRYILCGLSKW